MRRRHLLGFLLAGLCCLLGFARTAQAASELEAALARAGDNRAELERALQETPADQKAGMQFLVANMPDGDLQSLKAAFLLENTRLAYDAWRKSAWKERLPQDIFFNNVLPYASINERRDKWRADFAQRFQPLVKEAQSPSQAAAILNQKIFPLLNVRYSRQRRKADQSPYESIETGTASCTGLSVLLIDACRAAGVPARFAGTPLWSDNSGNHSWVEVWDNGWHFTGAAEPSGNDLDKAWFVGRASSARRDHLLHAIYAVSFKRTPQPFPMVWDQSRRDVFAVNVTQRYTVKAKTLADGQLRVMFRVLEKPEGDRVPASILVREAGGTVAFRGQTNDERFDGNDHLTAELAGGKQFQVEMRCRELVERKTVAAEKNDQLVTFFLPDARPEEVREEPTGEEPDASRSQPDSASPALEALRQYLALPQDKRPPLAEQTFAQASLTREEAQAAQQLLWGDHEQRIRRERAEEMKQGKLEDGALKMPFYYHVFGEAPEKGRSMYISMHGGGGAPTRVNDRQWENQKRLYQPTEGVYVVPRAPTDSWNLWHQGHIDKFFDRLIENMVVFENVNPNRVYLMGYSAGGDGVYQLAPRMADRFAAAAMMAGHPNETSPRGLRNLPFAIYVGGKDAAYNRNKVAQQWGDQLDELRKADPQGYEHLLKIYPDKGHWMDRQDASSLAWMHQYDRHTFPQHIVWRQDDVRHARFYWLSVAPETQPDRAEITARLQQQQIRLEAGADQRIAVWLNDQMLDLNREVTVQLAEKQVFHGIAPRTINTLARTLAERGDPQALFCSEVVLAPSVDSPGDDE